jgi:hypothetical protein
VGSRAATPKDRRREILRILIFEPPGARALVEDCWTDEMLDRIEANYEPTGTFALTEVYLPEE